MLSKSRRYKWYRIILDKNGLGFRVDEFTLCRLYWYQVGTWFATFYQAKRYIIWRNNFENGKPKYKFNPWINRKYQNGI